MTDSSLLVVVSEMNLRADGCGVLDVWVVTIGMTTGLGLGVSTARGARGDPVVPDQDPVRISRPLRSRAGAPDGWSNWVWCSSA
jgi:hypothetical protein